MFPPIKSARSSPQVLVVAGSYNLPPPSLPPPCGAEQKSQSERERERRIGPVLERLVDRAGQVVADLADRIDRVASAVFHVRDRLVDPGARAAPRLAALGGEDVG